MQQVRAIDVGYGNNKYTTSNSSRTKRPDCDMFPSVAPISAATSISAQIGLRPKTVRVEVDQITFEVGHDALRVQGGNSYSRSLDNDYCLRPAYRALTYGAMHYMGLEEIDLLVLGLPMTTWLSHKERLIELMVGDHKIGNQKVTVKRCKVAPQAYGGYLEHIIANGETQQAEDMTTLIIDPGFHTLDWIVCSGFKIDDKRSGAAADAGMCSYLKAIGDRLSATLKEDIGDLSRIDAALRNEKKIVRLFGEEHDLEEITVYGKQVAQENINYMANKIGNLADIDQVILVGGASIHFAEAVQSRFTKHKVQIAKDPIYANVRGFQAWGEEQMRRVTQIA